MVKVDFVLYYNHDSLYKNYNTTQPMIAGYRLVYTVGHQSSITDFHCNCLIAKIAEEKSQRPIVLYTYALQTLLPGPLSQ